jgi:spermidine/putrescine transport system substrate-binding protein
MFTLLFLLIFVLMVTMNLLQLRADRTKGVRRRKVESKAVRTFKRVCAGVLAACLLLGFGYIFIAPHTQEQITLNVYNWGQYIADGSDDSMEVIKEFEARYPHIKVNYSTYDSNEIMYSKLNNGGITVDLIIPSDYMIARLISEDMLLPLDFDNIPNYQYIDENFRNTAYDPENKYSVPYTWGTVGILYNTKYVDEADVTGWELLWNEKYAGKILTFGNSRDAFGVAQYLLGYDVNTTDRDELRHCAELLKEQKPVLQQYVMDEIFAIMQNEEAWIAPYYAGDCLTMMGENENLDFYLPENQGFNLFIDAMCIPTCAKEKEAAELFINFLCDPEIAGANMDWICYGTPLSAAKEFIDPETVNDPVTYPDESILANGSSYAYLPEDVSRFVESLFMEVRNG